MIYISNTIRTKTHILLRFLDGCTSIGCYKLDWLEGIGNLHAVRREGFNKTIYGAKKWRPEDPGALRHVLKLELFSFFGRKFSESDNSLCFALKNDFQSSPPLGISIGASICRNMLLKEISRHISTIVKDDCHPEQFGWT